MVLQTRTSSSAPNRQRLALSEMSPIDRWHCHPSGRDASGRSGRAFGRCAQDMYRICCTRCRRLARRERGLISRKTANVGRDYSDRCRARRRDPRCRLGPTPSTMRQFVALGATTMITPSSSSAIKKSHELYRYHPDRLAGMDELVAGGRRNS